MATVLQAQLARIASKSTNPLDLRVQRKAYAQSLLFEPSVAAEQDIDVLYDLCVEGFHELCEIDARFEPFSRTIFNEQSKGEDRSMLNSHQNEELDIVIDNFLGLLEARLLLRPAAKALEWLIRRFRIHELNTTALLCIFLPYHTQRAFATLLSILPKDLPVVFKFLTPFVDRLKVPSRWDIVYSATRHSDFLHCWSAHVLKQCQLGFDFHEMTAYWASVTTEATLERIELASRGNRAFQQQNEEALLLELLPHLSEGFHTPNSSELRIGCHMILTVLAAKLTLTREVLDRMMEAAIAIRSPETKDAELICLTVLAQGKEDIKLPRRVYKALKAIPLLAQDLSVLAKEYNVSFLVAAIIRSMIKSLSKPKPSFQPLFFAEALDYGLISEYDGAKAIAEVVQSTSASDANMELAMETLGHLCKSATGRKYLRNAVKLYAIDFSPLGMSQDSLGLIQESKEPTRSMEWEPSDAVTSTPRAPESQFVPLQKRLATSSVNLVSFFGKDFTVFEEYYKLFRMSANSSERLLQFCDMPSLQKDNIFSSPTFISFFVRVLVSSYPPEVRRSALGCIQVAVSGGKAIHSLDAQIILPYVLFALSDLDDAIRVSGIELLVTLRKRLEPASLDPSQKSKHHPFKDTDISGAEINPTDMLWITTLNFRVFLDIMLSHLEECRLDASHLSQLFSEVFTGSTQKKTDKGSVEELKNAQKEAILSYLINQILHAPCHALKERLLSLFSEAKISNQTLKSRQLLDVLSTYQTMDDDTLSKAASAEGLSGAKLAKAAVSILSSDRESLKMLQGILKHSSENKTLLYNAALDQLSLLWNSMKRDWQGTFALTLLEGALAERKENSKHDRSIHIYEVLEHLSLHPEVFVGLLESLPPIPTSSQDHESPATKRRKTQQGSQEGHILPPDTSNFLTKATIILELLEDPKSRSDPLLIDPLFTLLGDLHRVREGGPRIEYVQALLLNLLHPVIENAKRAGVKVDRPSVRADIVVDYFRNATNAQIQQSSLLLMSSLATFVPEQVIHSIMPIFTFMGTTIFRYSDDYSAHVIDKTIQSIVPPLISALRKDKRGPLAGASELLLSFVAAFDHIPIQRRQNLFIVLVDKLGPEEFLFALIIMLLDKHDNNEKVQWFALGLLGHFPALIQLKTMEGFLSVIIDSFQSKSTIARHLFSTGPQTQYATSAIAIAGLPAQLFKENSLLDQVSKRLKKQDEEAEAIRASFARILQLVIQLDKQGPPTENLLAVTKELLDATLGLIPLDEAVQALEEILHSGDDAVRRGVLHSLESQISIQKPSNKRVRTACLDFLPHLREILTESGNAQVKLACISCIDSVTEIFGKSRQSMVADVAIEVVGNHGLAGVDRQVQLRALLCLITVVEAIEDAFVPMVPQAAPTCLSLLEDQNTKLTVDGGLVHAAYAFFSSLFLYVPYIITGQYLDRLLRLSFHQIKQMLDQSAKESRATCLALVPRHINAHEVLHSLGRSWEAARENGPDAVKLYIQLLDSVVERLTKSEAVKASSTISVLCLYVLDLRQGGLETGAEVSDQTGIEESINGILMKLVYKLNDTYFRPIFAQLLKWPNERAQNSAESRIARSTSLYGFLSQFFETLQSVVTNYGILIVTDATELLQRCDLHDESLSLLWTRILRTLSAAFEHDQDGFWQGTTRFGSIMPALMDQLERATPRDSSVTIITCITHLARAAGSPDNLKAINTAILSQMRSPNASVRLNALRCAQSLTDDLGEDWLALLPEMLPFISEALEDDDEDVEAESRAWVRQIEETLGESLDAMLQ